MVAAVCLWHEQQSQAARSIERRLARGLSLVVAGHALLETYAVLTRLPAPYRLAAADAWHLLAENFANRASVRGCEGETYVAMLSRLAASGVTGGRSYDALIATVLSNASRLEFLTLNPRHFERHADGMVIIDPRAES
jgi:predicted nucleic acid-binding protein